MPSLRSSGDLLRLSLEGQGEAAGMEEGADFGSAGAGERLGEGVAD